MLCANGDDAGLVETLGDQVLAHGVPLAFYSGWHGIFRVDTKELETRAALSAFDRVTARRGIDQICATRPLAKDRVERATKTLQDRLIKEMRVTDIRDITAA